MPAAPTVDCHIRVRYAEADQMGVAYYAHYLAWFEMGRSEFCRAVGYPYSRIEEEGFLLVVAKATVRYKQPARYDDPLIIRSVMTEMRRRICRFGYSVIHAETGELIAEGTTTHLVVDRESGRPTSLPERIVEHFQGKE